MRISDWRSDVCSSDLGSTPISIDQFGRAQEYTLRYAVVFSLDKADGTNVLPERRWSLRATTCRCPRARPADRKGAVSGKSGSVRVDLGGRGTMQKKTKE